MAGLTKQHFEAIAEIIRKNAFTPNKVIRLYSDGEKEPSSFLKELCNYFETQNPNFNASRFREAVLN